MPTRDHLPPRQARFVQRYLANGLNGTQAAKDAGYSAKTAEQQAYQLLQKPSVRRVIDTALAKAAGRDHLKASKILKQLGRIAFGDPRKFFDAQGRLKPIHALDDDAAALLAGFEVTTKVIPGTKPVEVEYVAKVKFRDTKSALELLGKYKRLGLWTERHEHELGKQTLEELVAGAKGEPE